MKTGQIPFSNPTGLLGASGSYIRVSGTDRQVQCTSLMPTRAKEKSAFTFPAEAAFPGGHPAGDPLLPLATESRCQQVGGRAETGELQEDFEKFQLLQGQYHAEEKRQVVQ